MESSDLLKGVFLLILAVAGNFVAETLGCKTRKLLTENMYAKQIIILSIIYFAIDFTNDQAAAPKDTFINTLIIWIAFLMFTKMNEWFTIACFLLLVIGYLLSSQMNYLKNDKKKNKKQIDSYEKCIRGVMILFTILLVIGFCLYFAKQQKDHKKNWNVLKFIFGVHECGKL